MMNAFRHVALLMLPMMVGACGSEPEKSATPESAPARTAPAAPSGRPRVFFVEPKDSATLKSPVELKFGLENYELSAVPPGEITTVRPGVGHHHVGVDQTCMPPGTNIVKGTPAWIHFGKAETGMSPGLQLTPGEHKLSLQLADDMHNAIEGLCETITITVTQ
jgi:Domain of unknown function (DUF4399)/Family of unknown function (DUF6130)